MENIYEAHLISTEKNSRLCFSTSSKLYYDKRTEYNHLNNQILIIVSNKKIKEFFPQIVLEKLVNGSYELFQIDHVNEIDRENQKMIVASSSKQLTPNNWIDLSENEWLIATYNRFNAMPNNIQFETQRVWPYGTDYDDADNFFDEIVKYPSGEVKLVKPYLWDRMMKDNWKYPESHYEYKKEQEQLFTEKELRNIAVDFAYYVHISKQGDVSSEKHKRIFDEWYNNKFKK